MEISLPLLPPPQPYPPLGGSQPPPPEGCLAVYLLCTVGEQIQHPLHTGAGLCLVRKQSLLQLSKLCAEAVLKISRCPKKLKRLVSPLEPALSVEGQGIKTPPAEAIYQSQTAFDSTGERVLNWPLKRLGFRWPYSML